MIARYRSKPFGSSPRMRGTRPAEDTADSACRFIPAHAGNSQAFLLESGRSPVHPRACGELRRSPVSTRTRAGSSPRMRGTQSLQRTRNNVRRFIPAHAGNSFLLAGADMSEPVHPRACGELWPDMVQTEGCAGSSPRMRGTRSRKPQPFPERRCIPAHAGNSVPRELTQQSRSVDPRACVGTLPG